MTTSNSVYEAPKQTVRLKLAFKGDQLLNDTPRDQFSGKENVPSNAASTNINIQKKVFVTNPSIASKKLLTHTLPTSSPAIAVTFK